MEPGKIKLLNTGTTNPAGFTQDVAVSNENRLYRFTNDGSRNGGPGLMRIRVSRSVGWWTVISVFDLESGRSVDLRGSSFTVTALTSLELFGTYDTI
jgi:hypothetical protein